MTISNLLILGGTQGCGLETLLLLLNSDQMYTTTVLARNPVAFKQTLAERGAALASSSTLTTKLRIVKGDALEPQDISNAFTKAQQFGGDVDAVLYGVGGRLVFSSNPFARPTLSPESICERSIRNVTDALIALDQPEQPRLVVISSNGLGKGGHSLLPYLMRPLYSFLLPAPHVDKEHMEKHLHNLAGLRSNDFNPVPDAQLEKQPKIKKLAIVRPALLVNGTATKKYRVHQELRGGYTVRRSDVGHFIYNNLLGGPDDRGQYVGMSVMVAY
ncbi:conserved hypothetical protein [Sporisorium reilianum SRZ2]|uniref:NAD(P)-binding domain-containing protein n=2 Tax=Sporisorium reilianum TaxID=72558 RepID=E7A3B3_SPORE|nr:conserved hypothetical protein [Sporisorium reilianum SRZ2]SJX63880.1 uncharacterized protein SRS1_14554 [Sporisorium reilianum f. sp. reilianum]